MGARGGEHDGGTTRGATLCGLYPRGGARDERDEDASHENRLRATFRATGYVGLASCFDAHYLAVGGGVFAKKARNLLRINRRRRTPSREDE